MPHEVSAVDHNQSKPENIFTEPIYHGIVDSGIISRQSIFRGTMMTQTTDDDAADEQSPSKLSTLAMHRHNNYGDGYGFYHRDSQQSTSMSLWNMLGAGLNGRRMIGWTQVD
jgi:hypothetical protein